MSQLVRTFVCTLMAVLLIPTSWAADEKKPKKSQKKSEVRSKYVAADLDQVDSDFQFQGEYMGAAPLLGSATAGLQVIALGDGKFEAVLLRGGLPGAGWDRRTKSKLTGKRKRGEVRLENEQWEIAVNGEAAVVRNNESTKVARLPKIQRISPTQDAPPAPASVVLFDGSDTKYFQNAERTKDGLLKVGAVTVGTVGDFHLHLEFRTPYMPYARGQARGNSGIYIQQRYEVQILDSFGLEGVENECGGLYRQKGPDVNMCLPPLSWQTYDIFFRAARWSADRQKLASAQITVLHNGEPIHANYALKDKTGGGKPEGPEMFPILLQDHGNPVTFRNIWIAPLTPPSRQVVLPSLVRLSGTATWCGDRGEQF